MSESTVQKSATGKKTGITRRSFLKATGAVAGAAALAGGTGSLTDLAYAESEGESGSTSEEYCCACRSGCNGGCLLKSTVRDGKVVNTTWYELPDKRYSGRACLKGISHIQRIYDPDRIKYPMRRVGERGSGQWERISWDDAIEEITSKWKELREKYGPEAIAFTSQSGNMGHVSGSAGGWIINSMEAATLTTTSDMALINYSAKCAGVGDNYNANAAADLLNSKCIVLWGYNITNSSIQSWRFISEAQENGAKLVVIDTVYTGAASKADKYIFVRPGTDAALAAGMMNLAIETNRHDSDFIRNSTVGPFLVNKIDGLFFKLSNAIELENSGIEITVNGVAPSKVVVSKEGSDPNLVWDEPSGQLMTVDAAAKPAIDGDWSFGNISVETAFGLLCKRVAEYPVERVAEICDISTDDILELTDLFCDNPPTQVVPGFGIDHYTNGHYSVMSVFTLCAITGNYGKPGAGCGIMMPMAAFYGNAAMPMLEGKKAGTAFSVLQFPESLESGYVDPDHKVPCNVKSIYAMYGNWLANSMGRKENIERILKHIELHVCADLIMTDTAQYADIVLPVAHFFEQDDFAGSFLYEPFLLLQEKTIEPLYEAKTDFEIWKLLGKAMNVGEPYWDMSAQDYMKKFFDSPVAKKKNLSYERLIEEKAIPMMDPDYCHARGGIFPTPSKRFEFYFEKPAPTSSYGQEWDARKEQLPILFEPPIEAWTADILGYSHNDLSEKYPFILFQDHKRWRTHTQFGHVPWLRELDPEPVVYINDKDANQKGIMDGDTVRLFNDRGYVVVKAVIQPGIRQGCMSIPKGWQSGQFIDGHYQDLTKKITSPVCNNAAYYDTLVDVEIVN